MNAKDIIRYNLEQSRFILESYVKDLDESDLFIRPTAGMNHVAWQLGHLVSSECGMMTGIGKSMPALPGGFADAHSRDAATVDDRSRFRSKAEYLDLMKQVRGATLTALAATPESEFGKPGPESMRSYAPTVGAVFAMVAAHELMHSGQFVPIRRMRGKPIVI